MAPSDDARSLLRRPPFGMNPTRRPTSKCDHPLAERAGSKSPEADARRPGSLVHTQGFKTKNPPAIISRSGIGGEADVDDRLSIEEDCQAHAVARSSEFHTADT